MLHQDRPQEALRHGPKGERAFGEAPRNWGKNVTLIASMSTESIGAAMSVEGATDAYAFETYVEHFLVPTLKEGQVVMDNLQVRKSRRARDLIEGVGAEAVFLPPYSPDFSPLEEAFRGGEGHPKEGRRLHQGGPARGDGTSIGGRE